jgi:16S rRNA U516 pseudouridylate synthase RsuA-like enzyme
VRKPKRQSKRTNQSNWQHREKTKGAIKNGQIRATGNIERKPKRQSKMDKPEQLAT